MSQRPRSLKHEYELFVEREIEAYKESVSRNTLLSIGDEAVSSLTAQPQLALTELLLCDEVDRIIRARLRLPSYGTWRRRRLAVLKEFSRPERWGIRPDSGLARAVSHASNGHALVAGASEEGPALYLAANGCAVTTIDAAEDVLERVMSAALDVGLTGRIRSFFGHLGGWTPDRPLNAVVCSWAELDGLSSGERERMISALQDATAAGGVHILGTTADAADVPIDELRQRYDGWQITVEQSSPVTRTFLAQKHVA